MRPRSVLIVDDHEAFRESARGVLVAEGFEVVGTAPDGRAAIDALVDLDPDVVLLDVHLPGIDGFTVAAEIAALEHPPAVVLTSSRAAQAEHYPRVLSDDLARHFAGYPAQQPTERGGVIAGVTTPSSRRCQMVVDAILGRRTRTRLT